MTIRELYNELLTLSAKNIESSNYKNRYGISIMSSEEIKRLNKLVEVFNKFMTNVPSVFVTDYLEYATECVSSVAEATGEKTRIVVEKVFNMQDGLYNCALTIETKSQNEPFVLLEKLSEQDVEKLQNNPLDESLNLSVDFRIQSGISALDNNGDTPIKNAVCRLTWAHVNQGYIAAKKIALPSNKKITQLNDELLSKAKYIDEFDTVLEESGKVGSFERV